MSEKVDAASRHPFEVAILAACVVAGLGSVVGLGRPGTLEGWLPEYMVATWGWVVMWGGFTGLYGALCRDQIVGLLMERLSLVSVCGGAFIYALALLSNGTSAAWSLVSLLGGIMVACLARLRRVQRELKAIRTDACIRTRLGKCDE